MFGSYPRSLVVQKMNSGAVVADTGAFDVIDAAFARQVAEAEAAIKVADTAASAATALAAAASAAATRVATTAAKVETDALKKIIRDLEAQVAELKAS